MFTTTAQERPVRFDVAADCIRDEFRDLAFICTRDWVSQTARGATSGRPPW